jgi:hypothetical protein
MISRLKHRISAIFDQVTAQSTVRRSNPVWLGLPVLRSMFWSIVWCTPQNWLAYKSTAHRTIIFLLVKVLLFSIITLGSFTAGLLADVAF